MNIFLTQLTLMYSHRQLLDSAMYSAKEIEVAMGVVL